jgi:hypothetical protein
VAGPSSPLSPRPEPETAAETTNLAHLWVFQSTRYALAGETLTAHGKARDFYHAKRFLLDSGD